jgi:trigger factor
MELNVERLGPCRARVSFTVPSEEFEGEVRRLLALAGKNVKVKGFRPGHVPVQVVERTHGKAARREAINSFLQQAYERAMKEHALRPLAHPRVELPEQGPLHGADFSLGFEVDLRPEFELQPFEGLEVESELVPVLDQHVEGALQELALANAKPEPAGEEGLPADGMALCRVSLHHGDEEVLSREGLRLGPTTPVAGTDPEEFKRSLTGAREGATLELPLTFPEDFEREDLRGAQGTCRIRVDKAFRIVPATREQIERALGVEGEAALRAEIQRRLADLHRAREDARVEHVLLERLIEAHPMDLPEPMVDEQVAARVAQTRKEMEAQGLPPEQIPEPTEAEEKALRQAAERAARGYFLIEAIARKQGLQVTDEELAGELRAIAARNKASFEEVRDYYKEQNLIGQLALETVERKVRRHLRESARVKPPG